MLLFMAFAMLLALPAAALADAALDTSADLSTSAGTPTNVQAGANTFKIKLWATGGNIPGSKDGKAFVGTSYRMATDGTITADQASTQLAQFDPGYNYSGCPATNAPKGCLSNPFEFTATLTVAEGTPDGKTGTLTVYNSAASGSGLSADTSPAGGQVKVVVPQPTKQDQAITFGTIPNKSYGDAAFGLNATASSGLAVTYQASGTCTVSANTVTITGAGNCDVTASQAGNGSYNPAPNVTRGFTIAPKTVTGSFTAADKTYDGTDAAEITGRSLTGKVGSDDVSLAGGSASFADVGAGEGKTVNGSGFALTGAKAANYTLASGNLSTTADISKKALTVTADDQATTYGDALPENSVAYDGFVAGEDEGDLGGALQYTYSQNGSPVANPQDAGTYAITPGGLTSGNYEISFNNGTLSIAQATATISLGDLEHTYDGTPRAATVTTSPAGLDGVTVTYDGGPDAPTDAGSYAVEATLDNANYRAEGAAGTLVIGKAGQSIDFGALSGKTYGDADFALSASSDSGLDVSFASKTPATCSVSNGSVSILGAGTCTIEASQGGNNNFNAAASVSRSFETAKAQARVELGDLAGHTYDGTVKAATATTTPAGLNVEISYSQNNAAATPKNAGSYDVVATVNEANYEGGATGTLVINKARADINLGGLSKVYNGSPQGATVTTTPDVPNAQLTVTYDGSQTKPENAGSYAVVASLNDANYEAQDATGTLTIAKAQATISLGGLDKTYTGSPQGASFTTTPADLTGVSLTYDGGQQEPTDAGTYQVVASLANRNYEAQSVAGEMVIAKKATAITLSANSLRQVYDGTAKAATATTPERLGVDVAYYNTDANGQPDLSQQVSPRDAGRYHVVASLQHPNYIAQSVTDTLVIQKAVAAVTLGNLAGHTYDGTAKAATVTTTPDNLRVDLTYDGGLQTPRNAGSYNVAATVVDPNYEGSATGTLVINKAQAQVNLGSLTHVWDGTAKAASATTTPAGLNVDISYKQGATSVASPTAVGEYAVTATVNDANHRGNATGTLVISPWTFRGFHAPVDMGVWNTVKAGSTVPMKFEVFKGDTELKSVSDIKSAAHKQVSCGALNTTASDAVELTTTGATSLRFDTTSDQFIFNWKTGGTWSVNSCYVVTVVTQDGTPLSAYFKMK